MINPPNGLSNYKGKERQVNPLLDNVQYLVLFISNGVTRNLFFALRFLHQSLAEEGV